MPPVIGAAVAAGIGTAFATSAAIAGALRSAGFKFSEGIAGVGQTRVIEAIKSICDHYGVDCLIIRVHG